jgi:hypothetical protein
MIMGAEKNSALPSSSKVGRYGQLPKPRATDFWHCYSLQKSHLLRYIPV